MSARNRSNEEPAHELLYETGGDGWNEPEDDTWECLCGEEIASWVQRDPERSGRPDLDDVLHAHAVHVAAVVAVERERDALREDVKIRDAEITRQHGIILALDNDAEQALIDRDEAIEAESQAGDRIAAAIAENARLLARIAAVEAERDRWHEAADAMTRVLSTNHSLTYVPTAILDRVSEARVAALATPSDPVEQASACPICSEDIVLEADRYGLLLWQHRGDRTVVCRREDGVLMDLNKVAASPTPTGPERARCHNGHPFEPGIDVDMSAEGRAPDPRWCNVCGDTRPGPGGADPKETRE